MVDPLAGWAAAVPPRRAPPGRVHPGRAAGRAHARRDPRGPGDAPAAAHADRRRLGPALARLEGSVSTSASSCSNACATTSRRASVAAACRCRRAGSTTPRTARACSGKVLATCSATLRSTSCPSSSRARTRRTRCRPRCRPRSGLATSSEAGHGSSLTCHDATAPNRHPNRLAHRVDERVVVLGETDHVDLARVRFCECEARVVDVDHVHVGDGLVGRVRGRRAWPDGCE